MDFLVLRTDRRSLHDAHMIEYLIDTFVKAKEEGEEK